MLKAAERAAARMQNQPRKMMNLIIGDRMNYIALPDVIVILRFRAFLGDIGDQFQLSSYRV